MPGCDCSRGWASTTNAHASAPVPRPSVVPEGGQSQVEGMRSPRRGHHIWPCGTPCQHLTSPSQAKPWAFLGWNFSLSWTIWILVTRRRVSLKQEHPWEDVSLCFHEKVFSAVSILKSPPSPSCSLLLCPRALGWSRHLVVAKCSLASEITVPLLT